MKIRIGTRGSKLALIQTEIIKKEISIRMPDIDIETIEIKTAGDLVTDKSLADIGGKGLFVETIEKELLQKRIDIAVHSGKDIPSIIPSVFSLYSISPRANDSDVLVSCKGTFNSELKLNEERKPVIGTSSPRRVELLKRFMPEAEQKSLRGNVDTRINKVRNGEYDGIILALAGIERLNPRLDDLDIRVFDSDTFIPSTNQGIIVCETLSTGYTNEMLGKIINESAELKRLNLIMNLERILVSYMHADCYDAAAVNSKFINNNKIEIRWFYHNSQIFNKTISCSQAEEIINGRNREWKKIIEDSVI